MSYWMKKTLDRLEQIANEDGTTLEEAAKKLEKIETERIAKAEARKQRKLQRDQDALESMMNRNGTAAGGWSQPGSGK
jgi:hypothetical protein